MGNRRKAREAALQLLYGLEFEPSPIPGTHDDFWAEFFSPEELPEVRRFAELLVTGVLQERERIDRRIREASTNWKLERMAIVDRNILRLAIYELLFMDEIPAKVSLNEAIEVAKKFGSEDSSSFINGILDRISAGVTKA
ncbi:MAG: transcription antitermination factor NusB [Myxococcales bacterium]|nr:transcription antitermination factor NusB [Myxococcales bacterium]